MENTINNSAFNDFKDKIIESINKNIFVKITISSPLQKDSDLKNIYIKQTLIRGEKKLSFTYRYQKRDIVKNYTTTEGVEKIENFINNEFRFASLFTTENDYIFQKNGNSGKLKIQKAEIHEIPSLEHDKNKNRKIEANNQKRYLNLLHITDESGNVLAKSQDKLKQISHYIEILSSTLEKLPADKILNIADMGSGKGYLTFALYDYIVNTLKRKANITGVEIRTDMVDLCNEIAKKSNFENLKFVKGCIADYDIEKLDVLIALHACNTATDDAIAKGINSKAELIVAAPCCQHQIREEMEAGKPNPIIKPIIKHGIFMERQAELLTDTIRVLYLQYFGYKTKVIEFISDAHTHKNVMIIAQKAAIDEAKQNEILTQIDELKKFFGISYHYLESKWQK